MIGGETNPYQPPKSRVADAADFGALPMPRPRLVSIAVWRLWADIAFELLYKVYDARVQEQPIRLATTASIVTLILVGVMSGLVFMTGRRRNWARITYAIAFALGMSYFATHWREVLDGPFRGVVSIVLQSILQFVAMVLLFLPSSNEWFRSRRIAK